MPSSMDLVPSLKDLMPSLMELEPSSEVPSLIDI